MGLDLLEFAFFAGAACGILAIIGAGIEWIERRKPGQ